MAGLGTIRRGIGFGPLATITRGYLGGGFDFGPGVALAVLASPSAALVVAAPSSLVVGRHLSVAAVVASPSGGTISPAPSTAAVVPSPSVLR